METARTRLRPLRAEDLGFLRTLESDAEIMRHTGYRVVQTPEQTANRLKTRIAQEEVHAPLGVWGAELKSTGKLVGWFMLLKTEMPFPELGFMILKEHWGQGITTEVCKALTEYGFKLGYLRIAAVADVDNLASIRVLEKVGFKEVLRAMKFDKVLKREMDSVVYELLPQDQIR